jgi:hypothetical protein
MIFSGGFRGDSGFGNCAGVVGQPKVVVRRRSMTLLVSGAKVKRSLQNPEKDRPVIIGTIFDGDPWIGPRHWAYCRPMRVPRRTALVLAALASLAILLPAIVLAATVQDLATLATSQYNLTCTQSATDVTCNAPRLHPGWTGRIRPAAGQEQTLDTFVQTRQLPLAAGPRAWMIAMHQLACAGPKGAVDAFVNSVGNL